MARRLSELWIPLEMSGKCIPQLLTEFPSGQIVYTLKSCLVVLYNLTLLHFYKVPGSCTWFVLWLLIRWQLKHSKLSIIYSYMYILLLITKRFKSCFIISLCLDTYQISLYYGALIELFVQYINVRINVSRSNVNSNKLL